jgi:hypothetical protein
VLKWHGPLELKKDTQKEHRGKPGLYLVLYGSEGTDVVYAGQSKTGAVHEVRWHRGIYKLRREMRGLEWDENKAVVYAADISDQEKIDQAETLLISFLYCGRNGKEQHGNQMVNQNKLYYKDRPYFGKPLTLLNEGKIPSVLPRIISFPF